MSREIYLLFEGECPQHKSCRARIVDLTGAQDFLDLFTVECKRTLSNTIGATDGEVTFKTDCDSTYVLGHIKKTGDWAL